MGDFNIDLLKLEEHHRTAGFIDDMLSNGMFPLITKPTRVTETSATLIDHMFSNIHDRHIDSGIIICDVSDHFGIFSIINLQKYTPENTKLCSRQFNKNNMERFSQLLQVSDFSLVSAASHVNLAYDRFMCIYQTAFNIAFPIKTTRAKSKYVKREPWITKGILISSINKIKLLKKKLKCPIAANVDKYKHYRSIYNRICRFAKKNYFTTKINSLVNDAKQSWKVLAEVIKIQKRKRDLPSSFFLEDGSESSNAETIAEGFNTFFCNVGEKLSANIAQPPTNFTRHLQNQYPNFFISPVCPFDIISVSKLLRPKLSEGHDGISTKLLRSSIEHISAPLSYIFNLSFSTGIFPDSMKVAKVIPIFKSGNNRDFNNYRPISILPSISKLLEKIMFKRLYNFLNSNDIFYKHQYGFRANHSTTDPLFHFLKFVSSQNDKPSKDFTLAVFLDLTKAFDTVNHSILIRKLQHYGIRGIALHWFKSYLSGRKQYTEYNSNMSSALSVSHGVPQGSIMGPLLFLIYINDISNCTSLNILSFADDTTAYMAGNNLRELTEAVNVNLEKIYTWLCENKLSLNIAKTKYMIFSPKCHKVTHNIINPIHINNISIERCGNNQPNKTIKFLGINFDENLSWNIHVNSMCTKVSKVVFLINRAKNVLPPSALRSLYFALIHSRLSYGVLAWGNSASASKLFKVQKRAVRVVTNSKYRAHTDPLFKKLSVLKLNDMYKQQSALFMHDYSNKRLPISFHDFYPDPRHGRSTTRSCELNVYIPKSRTNFSKLSAYIDVPKIWNNLSGEIKNNPNRNLFKRTLKTSFMENYSCEHSCSDPHCPNCSAV